MLLNYGRANNTMYKPFAQNLATDALQAIIEMGFLTSAVLISLK